MIFLLSMNPVDSKPCPIWCESNTFRLAVLAELVEAHSPFDRLRANELKRTVLGLSLNACEYLGEHTVKNIEKPVRTFRVAQWQ